jgi:hypothetical protein
LAAGQPTLHPARIWDDRLPLIRLAGVGWGETLLEVQQRLIRGLRPRPEWTPSAIHDQIQLFEYELADQRLAQRWPDCAVGHHRPAED